MTDRLNPVIEQMIEPVARSLANAIGMTYADTANWQKYADAARKLLEEYRIWPRNVITQQKEATK